MTTSGPGLNAMDKGMADFTTQFQDQRLQEQLKALLEIGGLRQAPMGAYGASLSPLFGNMQQPQPSQLPEYLKAFGGAGQGMGAMASSGLI
jgi:hypothetical protein